MEHGKATATPAMRLGIRVDCVSRTDRTSPYHRIRAVGGMGADGLRWRLTEDAVIAALDNERAAFFVEWPIGRRVEIVAVDGLGESPDRLLALPDCD